MNEIVLALPCGRRWHGVAQLVLAGLAARLDLTVEAIEDWQLALGEILGRNEHEERVNVIFRNSPEQLEARIGPVRDELVAELERSEDGVGLRRVLSTLTDAVSVETSEDGRWIVLSKAIVSFRGGAG